MEDMQLCRWCKHEMPAGASFCSTCSRWQCPIRNWMPSLTTLGLGVLSIAMGLYIFREEESANDFRIEVDSNIEFIEHFLPICFDQDDKLLCPDNIQALLTVKHMVSSRLVHENMFGAERKIYLSKLKDIHPRDYVIEIANRSQERYHVEHSVENAPNQAQHASDSQ